MIRRAGSGKRVYRIFQVIDRGYKLCVCRSRPGKAHDADTASGTYEPVRCAAGCLSDAFVEQDFDFSVPDEDEEDEGIGSIFDDAGDDEDFVSDDLFKEDEDEDDMSDVDEDFSFGNLFGDDEDDEDGGEDESKSDLFDDKDED